MPHRSANELTPPAAEVERFRRDLEVLTGAAPTEVRKLGLAVSGGGDSMALLLLAAAAYPGAVVAATVDHGLRPESRDEAEMVRTLCDRLGVAHTTLGIPPGLLLRDAPALDGILLTGSLQQRARQARYHLLDAWAVGLGALDRAAFDAEIARGPRRAWWIATAHQQDDVAESFLMRAARGSGVGGLAAMPAVRGPEPPQIVRPLLGWTRQALAVIAYGAGVAPASDPSNDDPAFDRARFRALLAAQTELAPERLARSAQNLRHAEDALQWAFERERNLGGRVTGPEEGDECWFDPSDLPYELLRRFTLWLIEVTRLENRVHSPWREDGVDRLIHALQQGGGGTLAGIWVTATERGWHFRQAPPRRSL